MNASSTTASETDSVLLHDQTKSAMKGLSHGARVAADGFASYGDVLLKLCKDLSYFQNDEIGRAEVLIEASNKQAAKVAHLRKKLDPTAVNEANSLDAQCKELVAEESKLSARYNYLLHRVSAEWIDQTVAKLGDTSTKVTFAREMVPALPSAPPTVPLTVASAPSTPVVAHESSSLDHGGTQSAPILEKHHVATAEGPPPPRPQSNPATRQSAETPAPGAKGTKTNPHAQEEKKGGFKGFLHALDKVDKKLGGKGGMADD